MYSTTPTAAASSPDGVSPSATTEGTAASGPCPATASAGAAATVTATQVVVRVTPSITPMESVTRLPIASSDWPSTTAMKS